MPKNTRNNRREKKKAYLNRGREHTQTYINGLNEELDQLASLPHPERLKLVLENAARARLNFKHLVQEFEQNCKSIDPLYTLAVNLFYKRTSLAESEWTNENAFLQPDYEVLQAMLLQRSYEEYKHSSDSFAAFQLADAIGELVRRASREFLFLKDTETITTLSDKKRVAHFISERMKSQTQFIRNWGTVPQMLRYVKKIFEPLENDIEKETGLRVADLLEMYQKIAKKADTKFKLFYLRNSIIEKSQTLEHATLNFCKLIPEFRNSAVRVLNEIKSKQIDLTRLKEIFHAEANKVLPDVFMFTLEDFVNAYPRAVSPERLKEILNRWSLKFGELASPKHEINSFFLNNPVKLKPLIHWDENFYFFGGLEIFGSFCLDIIQDWIESVPLLKKKYESQECRSQFLEKQIVEEFQKYFPKTSVFHGNKGTKKDHGFDFESDVMVVEDEFMLLAEAKSYRITAKGFLGRLDRLKTKFEQLIVEPSEQSRKIAEYLKSRGGIIEFSSKSKKKPVIDITCVKTIVRLSISLESLGELSTDVQLLREAGLIDKNINLAAMITLSDLEVILDLLPGICQKAHYFLRRPDLAESEYLNADEMDLLVTYLYTGFNLTHVLEDQTSPESELRFELRRNSRHLAPYLNREITKLEVPKPQRRLTKWWREIIDHLEIERPDNWLEIGCFLLDMSIDEQVCLSKNRLTLIRNIERDKNQDKIAEAFYLEVGHKAWRGTIALLVYRNNLQEDLMLLMRQVWLYAKRNFLNKRILVLAYDIDQKDKPFSEIRLRNI